MKTSVVKGL